MNAFGRCRVALGAQKSHTKTKPGACPGSAKIRLRLTVEGWGHIVLGHNLLGAVGQCLCLRQKLETPDDFWVRLSPDFHTLILTEGIDKDLRLNVRLNPFVVVDQ